MSQSFGATISRSWPFRVPKLNGDQGVMNNWFGWDTVLEIIGLQTEFLEKTAAYLNKTSPGFDVCGHPRSDGINHLVIGDLESENPAVRDKADWILREELRKIFQMASTIVRQIGDENTVVGIVSDHGTCPKTKWVNVHGIMIREGWTNLSKTKKLDFGILIGPFVAVVFPSGCMDHLKGREKTALSSQGKNMRRCAPRLSSACVNGPTSYWRRCLLDRMADVRTWKASAFGGSREISSRLKERTTLLLRPIKATKSSSTS